MKPVYIFVVVSRFIHMKHLFTVILTAWLCLFSVCLSAQQTKPVHNPSRVFIIGEEEKRYESIIQQYSTMLFQVCDNSMEDAYDHWNNMLRDMESFAQKSNVDLKGIKIWMNVFWNNDGRIDYIVYHPKPNSKNMNYQELTQFFNSFMSQYQLPLKASKKFSHYGSASFPLFNKGHVLQEK